MERGAEWARAPPFACTLECRTHARGRNRFVKYEDFNQTDDRRRVARSKRNRSDAYNEKLMIARLPYTKLAAQLINSFANARLPVR